MVCQAEVWRPNGVNLATVRSNQARTRVVPVNSKAANPPPPPPGILRAFDRSFAPYSGKCDSKWGPPARAIDFRVGDAMYTAFMRLWVIALTFIVPCSFFPGAFENLARGTRTPTPRPWREPSSSSFALIWLPPLSFSPRARFCATLHYMHRTLERLGLLPKGPTVNFFSERSQSLWF